MKDYEVKSNSRIQELENLCATLESQVDESSAENNQVLTEQNNKFQSQLQEFQAHEQSARKTITDLQAQLQESRSVHATTIEQTNALQQDRDKQIQALQESNRVCPSKVDVFTCVSVMLVTYFHY